VVSQQSQSTFTDLALNDRETTCDWFWVGWEELHEVDTAIRSARTETAVDRRTLVIP
jgi:hypothetical protein